MKEDTILNLMINHHALIESMFSLFRDEAKEKSPKTNVSLSELTWEIKKHFFTEENAIFNIPLVQLKDIGVFEMINQLKNEHVVMLNTLKFFSEKPSNVNDNDMEEFSNLLESHRKLEEKELYPRLDKELQDNQKGQIISRIDEIPINADSNK
jgi:hemerythrin-like domain-containing protein